MKIRFCGSCNRLHFTSNFRITNRGYRQSWCFQCEAVYKKQYAQTHKQQYAKQQKGYRFKRKEDLAAMGVATEQICSHCKILKPAALFRKAPTKTGLYDMCCECYSEHTGAKRRQYKPSVWVDTNGYITIMVNKKQIRLHRYIMQEHLGRILDRKEVVHHINENKRDNRIENLQVVSSEEHRKLHRKSKRSPNPPESEKK